ncbi:MAG TPA: DUF4271 domain-containing protein [Gillisia sp.]|nr:DUF4271 domain-containing protein [Gillisia sp.]
MEALERYSTSNDLPTIIIVLILLLLVLGRQLFQNRFEDFFSIFTSGKFLIIKNREHKALFGFNVIMFFAHILIITLFLFVLYRIFVSPVLHEPWIILLRIFTAYGFFALLKITLEKIIANVFDIDDTAEHYLFQKHTYRNFISFLFFPVVIFLIYSQPASRAAIITVIIFFLIATLYSFFRITKKNAGWITRNWFYFILYLCALEITPYVILYKLITIS